MGKITAGGLKNMLRYYLSNPLYIHLSINERLNEPIDSDYKPIKIDGKKWDFVSEENRVLAISDWVEWVFSAGNQSVYGFFVKDRDGVIVWSERFSDGPYEILRSGDAVRIKPKIGFAT